MRNNIKILSGLLVSGLLGLVACTDVEGITVNEVNAEVSDTERYAQYLSNLNAYKNSEHQVTYGWFDNSEKTPYSQGQHITSVPDSVDVLVLTTPELADFEMADIQAVHEKGIRVACLVSYDNLKATYDELASDAATAPAESFEDYLMAGVENALAQTAAYDGVVVEYAGQNPDFMREPDRTEYIAMQTAFLNCISAWKNENSGKMLTFVGKPQNLSDNTLLQNCEHIILDSGDATTFAQLSLLVKNAMGDGIPADRFVMGVSTVSLDSSDAETGYWGDNVRALSEVAYWATVAEDGFTKAGIAIYDIQNDYYATNGSYDYVKEAIHIMNPAPVNL